LTVFRFNNLRKLIRVNCAGRLTFYEYECSKSIRCESWCEVALILRDLANELENSESCGTDILGKKPGDVAKMELAISIGSSIKNNCHQLYR